MSLIDTHCHLDMLEDVDQALEHAKAQELSDIVTIATKWSKRHEQHELVKKDSDTLRIWASVGIHPAHVDTEELPELDVLIAELKKNNIRAIGETGLDYMPGTIDFKDKQEVYFRRHIEASRKTGLPVVIHTREADVDTARILKDEHAKGAFPFLIHCFTASQALAETALELGGYISFSGIYTFPKCQHLRDISKIIPKERILIETDSPYLAPVPFRGKKNTPGNVASTAQCLADTLGITLEEVGDMTSKNAKHLFQLDG